MTEYNDFPLTDMLATIEQLVNQGCNVYLKWTCKACGERVMMSDPVNDEHRGVPKYGKHDEKEDGSPCGAATDLVEQGCNYMVMARGKGSMEYLLGKLKEREEQ